MESYHLNFNGAPSVEGSGGKPVGNFPMARQSSLYSLTFDELQNVWSGAAGKDFGSMHMDELLKNVWTAEETQGLMLPLTGAGVQIGSRVNLQGQGSLTLPRTLSEKTVDAVWRDLITKERGGIDAGKDGSGAVASSLPQRQRTLGEMTLEEFLSRAGVVREGIQQVGGASSSAFFGELSRANNTGLNFAFKQQPSCNDTARNHSPSVALNFAEARSSKQQQHHFPKQATVALAKTEQLSSSRGRGEVGIAVPSMCKVTKGVMVPIGSPANKISRDGIARNSEDASPISPPALCAFNRGMGCGGAFEKVIERRQRRMIKNRESAERSRARKQAYTLELEAEVAKLKELNEELQRKQEELREMQKNQLLEKIEGPWGAKRQCLRRTLTGPW